jgi:hypothetical protein
MAPQNLVQTYFLGLLLGSLVEQGGMKCQQMFFKGILRQSCGKAPYKKKASSFISLAYIAGTPRP